MNDERRVTPRQEIRAAVAYWGSSREGGGTLANISNTGALIEPASPAIVPGTPIRLRINGVTFSSVELQSEVVRTTPAGFAVCFEDLDPEPRRLLEELLSGADTAGAVY